ncbi:MAG: terpene cyclase/mutase family protein, partial [Planctomycetota bacterium]|nr:terpene cyclase/mutase family protein [Planctomycetota bacterium]
YGMTPTPRVKKALKRATKLIEDAQNPQGGWRYLPGAKDSDISISVCQVQALRAARNAGIHVKKSVIDDAVKYVRKSYIPRGNYQTNNGFWYQVFENEPFRPSRTSFALTSAGVTALYATGKYDLREAKGGLKYLKNTRHRPRPSEMHRSFDYFYGHYYAIQAFFQAGDDHWNAWYPSVRDEIVNGQHGDGRWEDLVGPNYATSMACVILQMPYQYLPIFER